MGPVSLGTTEHLPSALDFVGTETEGNVEIHKEKYVCLYAGLAACMSVCMCVCMFICTHVLYVSIKGHGPEQQGPGL